jgi:antitoxin FitA-like protein
MEAVMTDIILDLDDGLIRRLKLTAELKGRTLEEEIREIIMRAAPLRRRSVLPFRTEYGQCRQSPASFSVKT